MNRIVTALIALQVILLCTGVTLVYGVSDVIHGQILRGLPETLSGFVGGWVSILAIRGHLKNYLASLTKATPT